MKKQYLLCLLISLAAITGCSRKHKQDKMHYFQDFESCKGWSTSVNLSEEVGAHSGVYTTMTSKEFPYSSTFQLSPTDFDAARVKKIKISAWCYFSKPSCEGGLCLQIVNPANENKLWVSTSLKDVVKSDGKWTKVTAYADLNPDLLSAQNTIKVFVWNLGSDKIFTDDFEIEFSE